MIDSTAWVALTVTQLVPMCVFAFATSASPGPVNIVLVMSGARFGVARSMPYVTGATIGFIGVLLAVGAGLGASLVGHPLIKNCLAIFGSLYMGLIAYRIAKADVGNDLGGTIQNAPGFVAGVVAQVSNPKAWIVSISAISIYVSGGENFRATLAVFCAIFFVICALSLLGWSAMGAYARKRISNLRAFNITMALLLLASIVAVLIGVVSELLSILQAT